MFITPNMGLKVWNLLTDPFDHSQLAANFQALDVHQHVNGQGLQIPTGGIQDGAITANKIAAGTITGAQIASNAAIDGSQFNSITAYSAGINEPSLAIKVKGGTNIPAEQFTGSSSYTLLSTPDQVTGLVVSSFCILRVHYQAMWQESVPGAARAIIRVDGNDLQMAVANSPGPQIVAAGTGSSSAGYYVPLASCSSGLVSTDNNGTAYTGDASIGQAVGILPYPVGTSKVAMEIGGTVYSEPTTPLGPMGGSCDIFIGPGIRSIAVMYKTSSGTVKAKNRQLWAEVISYV